MAELLSDAHELQLQSFLRFSHLKRQQHQREILQCIDECEESSISAGEMYSSSDVRCILDGLRQEMQKYITKEIENAYHSSALLIKLQLVEAQKGSVSINVDTNQLENEQMLQQIRACEKAAVARPAADFALKRAGVLGGLGVTGVRTVADAAVVQQREQLRSEVEALRSRLEALQTAANAAAASKTELAAQLARAHSALTAKEAELKQAKSALQGQKAAADDDAGAMAVVVQQVAAEQAAQAAVRAAQQQLTDVQEQLQAQAAQVKAAEQALSGRLQDSRQWQQLRQLMQAKSQEVVQLRKKLAKYEPEEDTVGQQVQHTKQ